ncbi:MAG: sigma-54-dependent Fis family transcriptional regulator, partial [Deltaproteobacteria bacterium]|nr:sigma-54-dependent Fis family transcriptional regulator [Deltaproteobacteria bacterium]
RVLSATNRHLRADVQQEKFRSDLFYRIAVFPIKLPPLRERREDIPILVQQFVKRAAERQHKLVSGFDEAALAVFAAYGWPGNIRELQNEIERAVALARDESMLGLQQISSSIRDSATITGQQQLVPEIGIKLPSATGDSASSKQIPAAKGGATFREARAVFEAHFITDAIAHSDGNIHVPPS